MSEWKVTRYGADENGVFPDRYLQEYPPFIDDDETDTTPDEDTTIWDKLWEDEE